MTSGRTTAIALAILLCMTGAVSFWSAARASAGMDFYQMWIGGRMARETTRFYAPDTRARMGEQYRREAIESGTSQRHIAVATYRRNLEVLSTPLLYTLYAPLRGSYERDLLLFQIVVFLSFLGWVTLFARALGWNAPMTLLLLAFMLLAFEPVRSDARVSNMNHVIILLLAVAAWLTLVGRFAAAGAVLAIATLTKPYVILAIAVTWLFMSVRRRWRDLTRHAAGVIGAGVVAAVVSSLYFGSATVWPEWLAAFRSMPSDMIPLEVGNIALAVVLRQLTGLSLGWLLLIAVGVVTAFFAARWKPGREADVAAIALGCVAFQFGSPLVWVHHLLLTVPLVMFLLRPAGAVETSRNATRRQLAGAGALALIAVEPWAGAVPTMIQVGAFINVGLLVAYGASLHDLARTASLLGEDGVHAEKHGDGAEHDDGTDHGRRDR